MILIQAKTLVTILKRLNITGWADKQLYLYIKAADYTVVLYQGQFPMMTVNVPEYQLDIEDTFRVTLTKELHDAMVAMSIRSIPAHYDFTIEFSSEDLVECRFSFFGEIITLPFEKTSYNHPGVYSSEHSDSVSKLDFEKHLEISKRLGLDYSMYACDFFSTDKYMYTISSCMGMDGEHENPDAVYLFPGKLADISKFLRLANSSSPWLPIIEITSLDELVLRGTLQLNHKLCVVCIHYFNINNINFTLPETLILKIKNIRNIHYKAVCAESSTDCNDRLMYLQVGESIEPFFEQIDNIGSEMLQLYSDFNQQLSVHITRQEFTPLKDIFHAQLTEDLRGGNDTLSYRLKLIRHSTDPYIYVLFLRLNGYDVVTTLYTRRS